MPRMVAEKRGVPVRKVMLTQETDCLGLGDGELIIDASLTDSKADAMILSHINTQVVIMSDDRVYSEAGAYLGDYYI